MLSNLYLHHVLGLWFEREVKPRLRGRAFEIRYADDAALVFEREEDARRVLTVLAKRFARYGLRLHAEKTRLVHFRRPSQAVRGGTQSERSFTLLGFTHYWERSRKGRWVVQRKTERNRFTRAVRAVGQWCQTHRHWLLAEQQAALSRKLEGLSMGIENGTLPGGLEMGTRHPGSRGGSGAGAGVLGRNSCKRCGKTFNALSGTALSRLHHKER